MIPKNGKYFRCKTGRHQLVEVVGTHTLRNVITMVSLREISPILSEVVKSITLHDLLTNWEEIND